MLRISLAKDRVSATRFADRAHGLATCVTIAVCVLGVVASIQGASAGDLGLRVLDRAGRGVPDVVVVAIATDPSQAAPMRPRRTAVMDQLNRRFVPQVLAVQAGTVVAFPNNDIVSHQVYSFSPSRRFQLPLYKGEAHSPVAFGTAGLVVLGCNIHDEMVGYIYVTDSPYFATTDAEGNASIHDLPAGGYRLDAWGPRVADPGDTLVREITLERTGTDVVEWRLQKSLRPRPSPGPRDVDWDY